MDNEYIPNQQKIQNQAGGKKSGRKKKARRIIFLIAGLFLSVVLIAAAYLYHILGQITSSRIIPVKVAKGRPANILILGVDAGDYNNHTSNNPNRSDTMMLVHVEPKTKKIYMLSIPRDTKTVLKGRTEKLNAAHAIGGPAYTIKTIEKLLHVNINYYCEINYAGFKACVDAIGGVDIKIPRNMDYDAWKISIHFKKGEIVHMDGQKAEEYVRWRKNNHGGGYAMGDLGRIDTQQQFLVELAKKMKTPSGLIHVPKLIQTVSKYVETNLNSSDLLSLALRLARSNTAGIERETLPGEAKYIRGTSYYLWNGDQNDTFLRHFTTAGSQQEQLNAAMNEPAVDSDKATSSEKIDESKSSDTESIRKNVEVILLNSTGKHGLAALYKHKLTRLGYHVTQTGNYAYEKHETSLIDDFGNGGYGKLLKNDLGFGSIVLKNRAKPLANLVVILGEDSIK